MNMMFSAEDYEAVERFYNGETEWRNKWAEHSPSIISHARDREIGQQLRKGVIEGYKQTEEISQGSSLTKSSRESNERKDCNGKSCLGSIEDLKHHKQDVVAQQEKCRGTCGPWCTGWQNVYGNTDFSVEDEQTKETKADAIERPSHYRNGKYEVIDEMLIVFGPNETFNFCILNAWKYRARAPFKNKMDEDMKKSSQYLEMAKQIADTYEGVLDVPWIRLIKEEESGTS